MSHVETAFEFPCGESSSDAHAPLRYIRHQRLDVDEKPTLNEFAPKNAKCVWKLDVSQKGTIYIVPETTFQTFVGVAQLSNDAEGAQSIAWGFVKNK
jgi:hypothetical protein